MLRINFDILFLEHMRCKVKILYDRSHSRSAQNGFSFVLKIK